MWPPGGPKAAIASVTGSVCTWSPYGMEARIKSPQLPEAFHLSWHFQILKHFTQNVPPPTSCCKEGWWWVCVGVCVVVVGGAHKHTELVSKEVKHHVS